MKKTLVALAALASVSAFAQSSVSISGNADVGYVTKNVLNGQGASFARSTGVADGLNVPNRIILTVKEDLGGGMTASFVNEHGISPTNTQDWATRTINGAPQFVGRAASTTDSQIPADGALSTSTNRNTYVALTDAKLGEVRAGYMVSSLYNTSAQSGYFLGVEQFGALLKDFGMTEAGGSRANGVQYTSPKFGMFTGTVQKQYGAERSYSADQNDQAYNQNKAERTAFRADMDAGELKATYVRTNYISLKDGANGVAPTNVFGVVSTTAASNADVHTGHDHLSAIYNIGPVALTYQYNKAVVNSSIDANDRTLKSNQYGVQYTVGATSVYAITGKGTGDSNTARVNDISNNQYGVRYSLSKRTVVYAMAGTMKDNVPTAVNQMSKGTMSGFGLSHAF